MMRPVAIFCSIAVLLLAACTQALAQPSIPDPFFKGSFAEADQLAREQKRLHLVYLDAEIGGFKKAEERLWGNRTLGHWIQWHAVLSRVSASENPELFSIFESGLRSRGRSSREGLIVIVLRDGITEAIIPQFKPLVMPLPDPDEGRLSTKPTEVLFQANFVLEKLASTNPVWLMWHETKNPPPPAPPRVWFSRIEDANASICDGPTEGQSVLSMLVEARAQVARDELHEATGTYTWLWENLDVGRPWLKPLRRTIIAAEMAELTPRRAGTRARFVAMRDDLVARDAWADLPDQLDRYIMDEVVGEVEQSLMEIDYSINDPDEGSLIPMHQKRGLELISVSIPITDLRKVRAEQRGRVARLPGLIGQRVQGQATAEEWETLIELRRQILLIEVCRLHLAALRAGNQGEAASITTGVIDADADGSARLALASMAWAAGLADARHIAWTKEAIALGADDAGLLRLLEPPASSLPNP